MRHYTGICLVLMALSTCGGAAANTVALSQAHELYFDQYTKSRSDIISDSGLLFIKIQVERKASRKQTEFEALSEARNKLSEYLIYEKK